MKISSRALAYVAILAGASTAAADKCLSGSFILEYEGDCNRETLVEVFDDQVFSAAKSSACDGVTAEAELDAQLLAAVPSTTIEDLCASIYNQQPEVNFTDILRKNDDMTYEKAFFLGHSKLQEEVETTYETYDGSATSVLKDDGELVRVHYRGSAQSRKTEWPKLPNFESSVTDSNGNPTCTTSAAMCCWPKDRQAADNNGNCNRNTYSENCVDKNPGDNTDLCFVDLERGEASTGNSNTGIVGFPGDQDRDGGEGAIHCHGLAWANDVTHESARYKGNNIFFVSMYDHMYQRGYVENIPGAPMCGCVEQMPTVTRSDCTEIDATERFKITLDSSTGTVEGSITLADINFNACQGINNRNNDLWAYMGRLYYEGKIDNTQWGEAGRIITNSDCDYAVEEALSKKALEPGYDYDIAEWTNVAGRDNFHVNAEDNDQNNLQVATFGAEALRLALTTQSANLDKAPHGIIKRMCSTCDPNHKEIYYRRRTAIPVGFDLLHNILYQRSNGGGHNVWNEDFSLHSTYEDAVNDTNPWKCPNNSFNYHAPFYGECSPDGQRVRDQYSVFSWSPGPRAHVGYYIAKGEDEGFVKVDTHAIRGRDQANGMALESADGNTVLMTGHGRDIWSWADDFNFKADVVDDDFTAVVKVGTRYTGSPQTWSKSGLMVRTSLDPNSASLQIFRSGNNYICTQGRPTNETYTRGYGDCVGQSPADWFKIEKRLDVYSTFYGVEAADGEITWTLHQTLELPGIGDSSYVGLAVSSASYYQLEVEFTGFEVSQYYFPSAAPTISSAPTMLAEFSDVNNLDIGKVVQSSAGSWSVSSSGHDIWGTSDSFRFVDFPASGDVTVEMKVDSFVGDPNHNGYLYTWAKGGLMIRDTMDANSKHMSLFVTGSQGLANQWREGTGWHSGYSKTHNDNPRPVWLRLKKVGNVFTTYFKYDQDGAQWIQFGATKTMDFGAEFHVGIAVTSHHWGITSTLSGTDFSIY